MQEKRKRVVRAKPSRNGCQTCRTRHIKCDETQPGCQRCVKSGWKCPGYPDRSPSIEEGVVVTDDSSPTSGSNEDTPPSSTASPKVFTQFVSPYTPGDASIGPKTSSLLASTITAARWGLPRACSPLSFPLSTTPAFQLKITDVERHAWDFFYATTYPSLQVITPLAGLLLPTIQLSFEYEPIFRAITATGNAHSDPGSTFDSSLRRWFVQADRRAFHRQYGQALASLRAHMFKNAHDERGLQVVLGSCLLLILYSILEEQANDAKAHLDFGLRILQERSPNEKVVGHPVIVPPGPFARPVIDVFETLLEKDATLESAPATNSTFDRSTSGTTSDNFSSLAQARAHLDILVSKFETLQKQLLDIARNRVEELSENPVSHAVIACLTVCMAKIMDLDEHVVQQSRIQNLKTALDSWSTRSSGLLTLDSDVTGRAPLLMQIQHFTTSFGLFCLRSTNETDNDHWNDHFKAVVSWCKDFLHLTATNLLYWMQDPSKPRLETQHGGWSAEMRVLPALYLVGTKCRDAEIRRQARELLSTADRREGIHHSAVLGGVVGAIMSVETELARSAQGQKPSFDHREAGERGGESDVDNTNDSSLCNDNLTMPEEARFSEVIVGGGEGPPPFVKMCCGKILPRFKGDGDGDGDGGFQIEVTEYRADHRPFVMEKKGSLVSEIAFGVRRPRTCW